MKELKQEVRLFKRRTLKEFIKNVVFGVRFNEIDSVTNKVTATE